MAAAERSGDAFAAINTWYRGTATYTTAEKAYAAADLKSMEAHAP